MAEEEPKGTPPEGTPPEGTPPEGTPPEGTPPEDEVNWEQRYKDLQTENTLSAQRAATAEARIEELEQPPEEEEDLDLGGEGFLDKKTAAKMIDAAVSKAVGQVRTQSADRYFRKNYPELVKYENAIAGIMRNPKNPEKLKGVSGEERIDAAVKEYLGQTEEQKATAKVEAEAEAKAKEEAKRKASGLGPSSPTPTKSDEEGKSDAEELADRKTRQAKKRGLVT